MLLTPLPLSQTVTPPRTLSPLERDVLYGRPLRPIQNVLQHCFTDWCNILVRNVHEVNAFRLNNHRPLCLVLRSLDVWTYFGRVKRMANHKSSNAYNIIMCD